MLLLLLLQRFSNSLLKRVFSGMGEAAQFCDSLKSYTLFLIRALYIRGRRMTVRIVAMESKRNYNQRNSSQKLLISEIFWELFFFIFHRRWRPRDDGRRSCHGEQLKLWYKIYTNQNFEINICEYPNMRSNDCNNRCISNGKHCSTKTKAK